MSRPITKKELIDLSNANFEKLLKLIENLSQKELDAEFDFSDNPKPKESHWSRDKNVRDVLMHLYEWHNLLLNWINKNQNGVHVSFLPQPYTWKTYASMNLEFWEKHQKIPYKKSLELLKNSHKRVLKLLETFSNEELFTKKYFSWTGTTSLGSYCISSTSSHYDWAIKKINKHKNIIKKSNKMINIIDYIQTKYNPISIIVYGSYYDDTYNKNSDFDALVISEISNKSHDVSFVDGVQLDIFIYPKSYFDNSVDLSNFIHLFYSKILKDSDEFGSKLKESAIQYLKNLPYKTDDEIRADVMWCKKMLKRSSKADAEGFFRWHWVLVESLRIFCDIKQKRYFGSKKSLIWMRNEYPNEYKYYEMALKNFQIKHLEKWIESLYKNMEIEKNMEKK